MSTFLVLNDGRGWLTSNGIYDTLIEQIVAVLDAEKGRGPLGEWLLEQRCIVKGPGVGSLDLRELEPSIRSEVEHALPLALGRLDRKLHPTVATSVELLEAMLENPSVLDPNVRDGIIPATGERVGPGWSRGP